MKTRNSVKQSGNTMRSPILPSILKSRKTAKWDPRLDLSVWRKPVLWKKPSLQKKTFWYFTAPWIENEWSRYLWLIRNEQQKYGKSDRKLITYLFGSVTPKDLSIQLQSFQAIVEGTTSETELTKALKKVFPDKCNVPKPKPKPELNPETKPEPESKTMSPEKKKISSTVPMQTCPPETLPKQSKSWKPC